MNWVPLHRLIAACKPEVLIASLCLTASLIGAGFVFTGGDISGSRSCEITFIYGNVPYEVTTLARTVSDFIGEQNLTAGESDLIDPDPGVRITPGLVVTFRPAVEVLIADAGNDPVTIRTSAGSICELLESQGMSLGPFDRIEQKPYDPVTEGMTIEITRVDILDITAERSIDPPVFLEADPELPRGSVQVIDPGVPGLAEDITRVYYRNGEESTRVNMGSRTVREPVERISRIGTRSLPPLASRGGSMGRNVLTMTATAYDPGAESCWPYADGLTATGVRAGRGVCAVDPNVIPLGTRLWVEGYGYALACDTGGAIHGNKIDLCYNTRAEAIRWGRRQVLVYILE